VRGNKGRQLNRWRSERGERPFAHVWETGGGRRAWLRGQTNVSKVHTLKCAAYNLGRLLRKVWGWSKPRNAAAGAAALVFVLLVLGTLAAGMAGLATNPVVTWWLAGYGLFRLIVAAKRGIRLSKRICQKRHLLTGC
jgi:hypothetical protein